MLLAGLDIGTSGCKLSVYRRTGEYLGRVYREYGAAHGDGDHEIDAAGVWEKTREALREAAGKWPEIGAIGVTSFGETFVLLDENDVPLQKAMLYTDSRGERECARLCAEIGKNELARITGVNPHPMYSMPKLMWTKQNRAALFQKAKRVCLMADYIVYLLTGNAQIDYALASRTMAFDIRAMRWSGPVFRAAGIDSRLLSSPVPIGTSAGTIKPDVAVELGFSPSTAVVSAGHDQVAAAVGSGVFDPGTAVDGAGTVQCITPVLTDIRASERFAQGSYAIVPHALPGRYVSYAFSFTGGAALQWFGATLAGYAAGDAREKGLDVYDYLSLAQRRRKPTDLLVLPHFAGAATPYMDSGAKAAILGLTLSTTQADLFHAIMEGVCYEMRLNMEFLQEAHVSFGSLKATGGGSKNPVFMQMKADVLDMPVTALASTDAGSVGAAMTAGVAAGVWPDLRSAAETMITETRTYVPRKHMHAQYMKRYQLYRQLYAAIRPFFG